MALWVQPSTDPTRAPHPLATPCQQPTAVHTGRPAGPVEVSVTPAAITRTDEDAGAGVADAANLVFALYTGDFTQSEHRTAVVDPGAVATSDLPGRATL